MRAKRAKILGVFAPSNSILNEISAFCAENFETPLGQIGGFLKNFETPQAEFRDF